MEGVAAFIDGSSYAASVCDHAAWAASRLGAPVQLVHALGRSKRAGTLADLSGNLRIGARRALMDRLAHHDREAAQLAAERGRALLDDAAERMRGVADIAIDSRLHEGDPVAALEEMRAAPRICLVGKRGEDASGAMRHLGSNLERLLRSSASPVMTVCRLFRPIESFLIGVDGGPSAERAVSAVCASPLLRGAAAHVLAAGGDPARLAAAADRLQAAGFAVRAEAVDGPPEDAIARAVRTHDIGLLILGKSGHSRLRQLVVGSTSLELMRRCSVPVLIFP